MIMLKNKRLGILEYVYAPIAYALDRTSLSLDARARIIRAIAYCAYAVLVVLLVPAAILAVAALPFLILVRLFDCNREAIVICNDRIQYMKQRAAGWDPSAAVKPRVGI
jgi:hypothetical protein